MSFYLLLVRLVTKLSPVELDKIENFQEYILNYPKSNSGNDARIIVDSLYLLEKIFNKEKIQEQTWEEYESISSVHNNSGISSFSKLIKKTDEMKKSQKSILPISEELETFIIVFYALCFREGPSIAFCYRLATYLLFWYLTSIN